MEETIIQVRNLTCKSGKRHLLNNIDWTVKKGEQWVVFGMNGCGKTTLLSIVAGFRQYTKGTVELFGEKVTAENILEMRKRIGWVSNSFFDSYYKNETALEIIMAGKTGTLGLDNTVNEQDIRRAKELLAQFHMDDKINRPFCTMSKGERQNILLARALSTNPEILILDEPCSGLDVVARERVFRTVRQITEKTGTTVIYVTHYAEELLDVFTHAMLLKKGKIYHAGTMEECFRDDMLSGFLETPVSVSRDSENRLQIHFHAEGGALL